MTEINRFEVSSESLYDLAHRVYSKMNKYLSERNYKVVHDGPYTYIIKNGKMWYSKCKDSDTFAGTVGVFVAFYRMKGWDLPIICEKCKISDLKPGDKFKITTGTKYFYTYDAKSYSKNTVYCIFNRDNALASFDGDTMVFKID